MRIFWRPRNLLAYVLSVVTLLVWQIDYASAQTRVPIGAKKQAAPTLVQNVESLEIDLARMNARPNVKKQFQLDELKTLAAIAPANLETASADRLREILKAFDTFPQDRRNSTISGLSTFKATHKGLQALVAALPKPEANQDESKRKLDPAVKPRTIEKMQEQPKVLKPGVLRDTRSKEATKPTQIPNLRTSSGPIICRIPEVPRSRGLEQRKLLLAMDKVERDVFRRADGVVLRKAFPFAELKSLASVNKAEAASQRRLGELLTAMNALSLDPSHVPTIRNESVANLHDQLRELVELSKVEIPSTPLAPANDLAATELYGTVENWKSTKWTVRLHVVACADNDGKRKSTMTKAQVQQGIALANKVFEPASLRFVFDPEKDWEELKHTKINSWDLADHDKNAAAHASKPALKSKIVIFSAFGPDPLTPNGWAANGGTHIWVPTSGLGATTLCHELGHFLGRLFHTFPGDGSELVYGKDPSKITAANVDSLIANFIYDSSRNTSGTTTEQAMDGDGFSDTPPDPGSNYWSAKWPGKVCDPAFPTATVSNPSGPAWVFTPDRTNLLSYFFDCPALPTITPQQVAAILGRLEGTVPQGDNQNLQRLIAGQVPWSSSFGDLIIVGKVRNVGSATSTGGRTAVLESVGDANTANVPLGTPVTIGPLAPNDWVLVKVPMPDGLLSGHGKVCLKISSGDGNPANDTLCPEPYKAPQVK